MHNYDSTLTVFFKKVYYDKSLSLLLSCERPFAFEKGDDLLQLLAVYWSYRQANPSEMSSHSDVTGNVFSKNVPTDNGMIKGLISELSALK